MASPVGVATGVGGRASAKTGSSVGDDARFGDNEDVVDGAWPNDEGGVLRRAFFCISRRMCWL